jgi:hypothetical protein
MNFTAVVTYANGRVDSNNGCRTLAHAESYLKFAASPLVVSVQVINRKGEIVRSAS